MRSLTNMSSYLDIQMLSDLVRTKRGYQSLRGITAEIKVSPSTILRVERGAIPDMETFLALCDWLEIPPSELIRNTDCHAVADNFDYIRAILISDRKLDPVLCDTLLVLLEIAYKRRQV